MPVKIAINGHGRVGRTVLRALYEQDRRRDLRIVAVNDLGDAATNAHLTRYDTVHGRFSCEVGVDGGDLVVDGDRIKVCAERDPSKLPWASLGEGQRFEFKYDYCKGCGICVSECPCGAIAMVPETI